MATAELLPADLSAGRTLSKMTVVSLWKKKLKSSGENRVVAYCSFGVVARWRLSGGKKRDIEREI